MLIKYYNSREDAMDHRYYGDRVYYDAHKQRYYIVRKKRAIKQRIIIFFKELFA
jgi:hypothetical protein